MVFLLRQRGVVLISALLILTILSLITAVYMMQARQQLRHVAGLKEKAEHCRMVDNHFDHIAFRLLSSNPLDIVGMPAATFSGQPTDSGRVNFSDQAFTWYGSDVRLQDMAGLLGVGALAGGVGMRLLANLGVADRERAIFLASLSDWEDGDDLHRLDGAELSWYQAQGLPGPRNAPLESVAELRLIRGYPLQLEDLLRRGYITRQSQSYFNPLTAPLSLLAAFFNDSDLAAQLFELRAAGELDGLELQRMTGLVTSEYVLLAPSLQIRMHVSRAGKQASCSRSLVLDKRGNVVDSFTLSSDY